MVASERIAPRSEGLASELAVRVWLYGVAFLVFLMIVVGGATRLTDSGLSITEWKPILGAIPPLDDAHWQEAFAKYREIPEYHLVNKGMSLEEFKVIYWWEWSHRFLGRFIGVAFAIPLAVFWFSGALRPGLAPKLLGVLALGGLQGAIGWFMVQSGLVDRVDVSHYRLALHLGVAFLILAAVLWLALDLGEREAASPPLSASARTLAVALVALVLLQVLLGALVAGLKAGLLHNTWPLMDGALVPDRLWALEPWYLNLFENETTVQFNHRLVAYAVTVLAGAQAALAWRWVGRGPYASSANLLLAAVLCQVALGIWTLLAAVPLSLGLMHQGGAAIVLALAVRHAHVALRAESR